MAETPEVAGTAAHGLVDLLPEVFRAAARPASPLAALGAAADEMRAPVVAVLDRLDAVVDPYRAPSALVPYLAGWVDLDWLVADGDAAVLGVPADRLRDLVAAAAELSVTRGTPAGLARFLHLATGVPGFGVETDAAALHVVVAVPRAAADQSGLVARLVAVLKPAHVTAELAVPGAASPELPPDAPAPPSPPSPSPAPSPPPSPAPSAAPSPPSPPSPAPSPPPSPPPPPPSPPPSPPPPPAGDAAS